MYSLAEFNGLLFYMNIDLLYYISKDIIKNYLSELFSLESYIGYIPLTLNPLNLAKNDINKVNDIMIELKQIINDSVDNNDEVVNEMANDMDKMIMNSFEKVLNDKPRFKRKCVPATHGCKK